MSLSELHDLKLLKNNLGYYQIQVIRETVLLKHIVTYLLKK